ncbi:F-box protein SKIP31-like [Vigna radiata var. radiata]|uniref:F-box protein SKIP31-like n=1 Tax=Vigna radiata var. radiata TaxID=3916 RepID=A0A1S3TAX7_VIGRR|nr:F-box protein SKIP31-like [Vigna radiata var. radiata]
MLLLVDFFDIILLQEMYTQTSPQFRDELHRDNLPSSLVKDKTLVTNFKIVLLMLFCKSSKGLSDVVVADHICSGENCSYYQIGDVFIYEKTGQVHVCDGTCREVIMDPTDKLLVCTISGQCFDRLLSPSKWSLML